MSFFDETKNAGILLLIIALMGIVFAVIAVFALDGYKDADTWKKIVYIIGAVVGSAVFVILGLDIMNGSCRFQIGNLFSDVTSKFGVLVALTAAFGISEIINSIFSVIAGFDVGGQIGSIVVGILFIIMAVLLAGDNQDARKVVWIILLILYIIMLIFSILACLVLIGIPMLLLSIMLVMFLLSPEVKSKCDM